MEGVVAEYAKPLVEDPRKSSPNHSSILEDLPATFVISEARMNDIMERKANYKEGSSNEDNEEEQKVLLQNLLTNLRESRDEEFDMEDANHNYLSDDDDDEEFPDIEFEPMQYASVRSQSLRDEEEKDLYDDRNYWSGSRVSIDVDVDELLKTFK